MSKKNNNIKPLEHDDYVRMQNALAQACIGLLGFNPETEYTIPSETLQDEIKVIPENIMKIQNLLIYFSNDITDEIIKSKKYIYKVEKRSILVENRIYKNNSYIDSQTIFHIVGKTSKGYYPAKLVLTDKVWLTDNFCKSLFTICIKNKEFMVLDRVDMTNQTHTNKFLDVREGKLCLDDLSKRYIPAGTSHHHRYSPVAATYNFRGLIKKHHNNPFVTLFDQKALQLEAKIIDKINNKDDIMKLNISNLNISCLEKCPEDKSLGEFFEECYIKETKQLGTLLKNKDPRVKAVYTRLPSDIIMENINSIQEEEMSTIDRTKEKTSSKQTGPTETENKEINKTENSDNEIQ